MNMIDRSKEILKIEAESVLAMADRIDNNFANAVDLVCRCNGRVVITGVGKPGIIGKKISATLASTGTPSLWMHPGEAVHGDMGMVMKEDVVITISNSGETEELVRLVPLLKKMGSKLIAFTGKVNSTIAKYADVVLDVSVPKEACGLGLVARPQGT